MIVLRPFEWALLAGAILAVLELLGGTFVFLGFAVGCFCVAALDAVGDDFNLLRDGSVFAAVACVTIVTLRRTIGRASDSKHAEGDVNDY